MFVVERGYVMKTEKVYLQWMDEYAAFGVADEVIKKSVKNGCLPIVVLKDEDYEKLGCKPPKGDAPTVGFLLGREKGHYTMDFDYAKAIAQSNVKMRFLTYGENVAQMEGIDGLILPGGGFNSPNEFYTDPLKKGCGVPGERAYAYVTSVMAAKQNKIPVLGVCAGAQILGGMHGMKMYRSIREYTDAIVEHNTKNSEAHKIFIDVNSPLYAILKEDNLIVNSRHNESMVRGVGESELSVYALSEDGIPEAWGSEKENILCVQWHPENFASKGDEKMQKIYDWIALKAREYQKRNILKKHKRMFSLPSMLQKTR